MEYIPWILTGLSIIVAIIFGIKGSASKKQSEIRELRKDNKDLYDENKEIKHKYEELEKQYKTLEETHKDFVDNKPEELSEYDKQLDDIINYNPKF